MSEWSKPIQGGQQSWGKWRTRMTVNVWALGFAGALFAPPVFADSLSDQELHYLVGHYELLRKNYGACADQFFPALKAGGEIGNRARLYLSYCQFKLKLRGLAAFHNSKVDPEPLTASDRDLYSKLTKNLQKEMDQLPSEISTSFYPYFGLLSFDTGPKRSGNFYGLYADLMLPGWKISAGGEQLTLQMTSGLTSYSQDMGMFGFSFGLGAGAELHLRGIYIYSNLGSQSGVVVGQLGSSFGVVGLTRLRLDGVFSYYPNLSIGVTRVFQGSVVLEQGIVSGPDFDLSVSLGSHTEVPVPSSSVDRLTGFVLRKIYERGEGGVNARVSSFHLGGSYWAGLEAFGVRNDGAVIFSALEEHRSGWGLNSQYDFSSHFSASIKYSNESYLVGTLSVNSSSAFCMLTFTF